MNARLDTALRARTVVAAVVDPEIPDLTIEELGILRDVTVSDRTGLVSVDITPTYTGCPAIDTIRADIRRALAGGGLSRLRGDTCSCTRRGAPTTSPSGATRSWRRPGSPRRACGRGPARTAPGASTWS